MTKVQQGKKCNPTINAKVYYFSAICTSETMCVILWDIKVSQAIEVYIIHIYILLKFVPIVTIFFSFAAPSTFRKDFLV